MKVNLKKLSVDEGEEVYLALNKLPADDNGYINSVASKTYDEFKQWLVKQDKISNGIGLKEWQVRQSTYLLYINDILVGTGKIRHQLTSALREEGGNIGYAILPDYRSKGYGTILLNELLNEAKNNDVTEILVTIHNSNFSSIRVAEKCGGIFIKKNDIRSYYIFE